MPEIPDNITAVLSDVVPDGVFKNLDPLGDAAPVKKITSARNVLALDQNVLVLCKNVLDSD